MILLIDNYDSFVYNLARYFVELGQETRVVRNDSITVAEIRLLRPDAVVLSPGPCTPAEAGVSIEVVQNLGSEIPMLGVCLGHQVLAAATGTRIIRAAQPVHGRTSAVNHERQGLFSGLSSPLHATRYHSLIIDEATLPAEWNVTARLNDGTIMAIEHRTRPLFGVQFHPESILTVDGHELLRVFLESAGIETQSPGARDLDLAAEEPAAEIESPHPGPLHW